MPHHFQGFHWFNPSSISYHIWQSEQSYEHIHPSILKRRRNPSVGTIQSGCWRPSDQSAVKSAAQFCWQVTLMFHFSWPHLLTSWYRGNIVLHQDIIETLGHFFFGEGGGADPVDGQQFVAYGLDWGKQFWFNVGHVCPGISRQRQKKTLVEALKCKLEGRIWFKDVNSLSRVFRGEETTPWFALGSGAVGGSIGCVDICGSWGSEDFGDCCLAGQRNADGRNLGERSHWVNWGRCGDWTGGTKKHWATV